MALETIVNVNIDFIKQEYLMIKAKQYDNRSRFICITCYNNGILCPLDATQHSAYVSFKKADGHFVFNFCTIDNKGRVLVELTEQMLASIGTCYAEIKVVNKGKAIVDVDTNEILIDDDAVLTTMTFYVDVCEGVVDDSLIESDDEFLSLNETLGMLTADFTDVIQMSKSWAVGTNNTVRENDKNDNSKYYSKLSKSYAVGDTDVRENEDKDNAMYYYEQASKNADNAIQSASEAYNHAKYSQSYAVGGTGYRQDESIDNAMYYYEQSKISEHNAEVWAIGGILDSEENTESTQEIDGAKQYAERAAISEAKALASEERAKISEYNASVWVEGGTLDSGSEAGLPYEVIGAKYFAEQSEGYYLQIETLASTLNGTFIPAGTVPFVALSVLGNANTTVGTLYNINEDFVSDETFADGGGVSYEAGTNVYWSANRCWECLVDLSVTGIKGNNEIVYRKGNVNLTAENIGAVATTDVATVAEMKAYLGI